MKFLSILLLTIALLIPSVGAASALDKSHLPQLIVVPIGTQAATASLPGPKIHRNAIIRSVKLVNGDTLAADDTNYLVVELKKGSTVLSTCSTKLTGGVGDLTTLVAMACVGSNIAVSAGDQLSVVATKNGTGVPTLAVLQLELELK